MSSLSTGTVDTNSSTGDSSRAVLYLNFDGVDLSSSGSDDATENLTAVDALAGTHRSYAGSLECEEVAEIVAEHFAAFEIDMVCDRPDGGSYTMVVVSTSERPPGGDELPWQALPPDCGNANKSNVALVEVAAGAEPQARAVAVAVSHVAGITYGFDEGHDASIDLASFKPGIDATWFDLCFPLFDDISCPEQNLANCGAEHFQNSYLELAAVLGER